MMLNDATRLKIATYFFDDVIEGGLDEFDDMADPVYILTQEEIREFIQDVAETTKNLNVDPKDVTDFYIERFKLVLSRKGIKLLVESY
jgi:hypothetical protein